VLGRDGSVGLDRAHLWGAGQGLKGGCSAPGGDALAKVIDPANGHTVGEGGHHPFEGVPGRDNGVDPGLGIRIG